MSGGALDAEKIVAQLSTELLKAAIKGAGTALRSQIEKLIAAFTKDFQPYLVNTLNRCSNIKTILNRDEPVPISNIYVKTKLKSAERAYDDASFIDALTKFKALVVIGTAGSGKSMFMRHLFISLFDQSKGRIPLFIELRQLNSIQSKDLIAFMYHSVTAPGGVVTADQFEAGLKNGLFAIIFDGLDEIDFDQRKELEKQIQTLQLKYPDNTIVVSSRPDERFESWESFRIFHVQPMVQQQIIALIEKLDYDTDIKTRFVKALQSGLYRKHSSFLSNPLLAIMMLITFEQFAHIPDKIHIFYEQAFDALFFKHDASKQGGYRRKAYTALAIDDFKKCLSSFCMTTYAKEKLVFSDAEARDYLQRAFEFEKQAVDSADFIRDLLESVCIFQRDGLFLTFSHRSFQEYFSAYFISRGPGIELGTVLDHVAKRQTDNVLQMSFDINRNLLEREWILPRMDEIVDQIKGADLERDFFGYLGIFFQILRFQWDGTDMNFFIEENTRLGIMRSTLRRLYSVAFSDMPRLKQTKNQKREIIRTVILSLKKNEDTRLAQRYRSNDDTVRIPGKLGLNLCISDGEWLKDTWLYDFVRKEREIFLNLHSTIGQSVTAQRTMISGLFD